MERLLAQLAPGATTLTTLYTVPSSRVVGVTALCICNRGAAGGSFRISIGARGEADDAKQYLYYDESLAANTTLLLSNPGVKLQSTDVLRAYASSGNFSFSVFGDEH
jgi:hypothetical protein